MKKLMKVSMQKFKGDNFRTLTYYFDFKNEEIADKIIDKLEEKFEEWGYDWSFARCPYGDGEMYGDAVDIPFENGMMAQYKQDMRKMVDEVKAEMGIK